MILRAVLTLAVLQVFAAAVIAFGFVLTRWLR
jgi:hypothetical protein